jgi:hypothetical protein
MLTRPEPQKQGTNFFDFLKSHLDIAFPLVLDAASLCQSGRWKAKGV